jgi:autotransporter-associated beta strand protein
MSEHAWTQEHVAAFVVGGLTAAEAERLESHARDCPDCAAAIAADGRIDRGLSALFADVRPAAGLEDRAIRSTRTARSLGLGRLPRWAVAAMILLMLGSFGALSGSLVNDGRLPLPGSVAMRRPEWLGEAEATASRIYRESPSSEVAAPSQVTAPRSEYAGESVTDFTRKSGSGTLTLEGTNSYGSGTTISGGTLSTGLGSTTLWGDNGAANATRTLALQGPSGGSSPISHDFSFGINEKDGKKSSPPISTGIQFFRPTENQVTKPVAAGVQVQAEAERDKSSDSLGQSDPVLAKRPTLAGQPATTTTPASDPDPATHRIVIRSGQIEFEVASFDAAVDTVTKLVAGMKGAFVATVNSDKLANGKVRGSIVVRTPPEHLDRLVLDLRRELGATGELKGMKVGSQDITKQYTDLESRLRAARAMEQRLLQMIKDGKGEIKQLLEAEKELGVWRTRIEEIEGELRYYSNLVSLSTLTISLAEKEIRAAASITETERVQAGVEVEDVDAAYRQAMAAVTEAKGRVAKSEVKQLAAGQFNATLQFEVPPDAAGPVRDRLRQLGRVARLEIDRVQNATGGSLPTDAKVKRGDTLFLVQLYNLANIAPRETATLQVAVPDVRVGYQALRDAAGKANARVRAAQLNEQDAQNVTAQIEFEVRRTDDAAIRSALDAAGEVVSRQITRSPEGDDATDSKVLYRVAFLSANRLNPRETTTMLVEVPDVDHAAAVIAAQVAEAKGRQVNAQSSRDRSGKMSAKLTYEVPLAAAGIVERIKAGGTVRTSQVARDPQAPDGKFATARLDVTLVSADSIMAEDDGVWPQVRRGLAYSASVLLTSVTWVVFGLCVVLPWMVIGYAGYRLVRMMGRPARVG